MTIGSGGRELRPHPIAFLPLWGEPLVSPNRLQAFGNVKQTENKLRSGFNVRSKDGTKIKFDGEFIFRQTKLRN